LSGEEEQASEHHSKQAGRAWEVNASFHWIKVILNARFEKVVKSQVASLMAEVFERGKTEANVDVKEMAIMRSGRNIFKNCVVGTMSELDWLHFRIT
jgi:hypothetical protein